MVDDFHDGLQQAVNITFIRLFNRYGGLQCRGWNRYPELEGCSFKLWLSECNERGKKLLNVCATNGLFYTDTCLKQSKTSREWTWESPDGVYHNKIDYIIVYYSKKMRSSLTNARSLPSADVGSDHQLVLANIKLELKAMKKHSHVMKRFNVSKLKSPESKHKFKISIGGKSEALLN